MRINVDKLKGFENKQRVDCGVGMGLGLGLGHALRVGLRLGSVLRFSLLV